MPEPLMIRRRRRLLDRNAIVEAALALVEESGSLKIADLADRLGASPSSIYHHVASRSEILALVRERVLATVSSAMEPAAPWAEQVLTWVHALRGQLAQHPLVVPLLTTQEVASSPELAGYDRVVAVLRSAGFPDHELLLWVSVLDEFAIGSALDVSAPEQVWLADEATTSLSIAVRACPPGRARVDAAFALGAAAIVAGMEQHLSELRTTKTRS